MLIQIYNLLEGLQLSDTACLVVHVSRAAGKPGLMAMLLTKEARSQESQQQGLHSQNWSAVSRKAGSTNGKELKQDSTHLNLEEASLIGNALLPGIYNHFSCNCFTGRQISSTSPVLPTDPTVLLQVNIAWKPSLFVTPFPTEGKESAAPSVAQSPFSSVPHTIGKVTFWDGNFI